jgi:transposase
MKVSGLDVHKDSIFCAIYNGKDTSLVQEYSTMTNSIRSMGNYLLSEGVSEVAMESTSSYWVPIWDILQEMGFSLTLVNPYQIKQMPGRKSDVKDAQWIACLLHKGLLRGSMIPNSRIRELRTYSRHYTKLQQQKTRCLQKMDRLMVMSGIRIGSCMSNLGTKSVMNIVSALIEGKTDPLELEQLVYGNTANKRSGKLREALTGTLKEHHRVHLEWEKALYDLLEKQSQSCLARMEEICMEHYRQEMELIMSIPGISRLSAMIIIAETGADMNVFENSGKLTGWAGLRPRNEESAGKYKSTAITKGNKYLRAILVQIAWAAVRTKQSFFMEKYRRLSLRKSNKKALIAITRKLLVIIWHVWKEKHPYNPLMVHVYDPVKVAAKIAYHQKEIEKANKLVSKDKFGTS